MNLVGLTQFYKDGVLHIAPDLAHGDANYLSVQDKADADFSRNGLDLTPEPKARRIDNDPGCTTNPLRTQKLAEAGVSTMIWATGFTADYSCLDHMFA